MSNLSPRINENTATSWQKRAAKILAEERKLLKPTPLRRYPLPSDWEVELYFKDESMLPSGSLKHRLANALISYGISKNLIDEGFTLVDASSGSTAVSEAYFARSLGLKYIAVLPKNTSAEKIRLINEYGGETVETDSASLIYEEAAALGARDNYFYLDQFGNGAKAYDWLGTAGVLLGEINNQLEEVSRESAAWIVVGIGTGATSSGIGNYIRKTGLTTRLMTVDPEGSVFSEAWRTGNRYLRSRGSRIEGIGRPRVEPSFNPDVIDRMVEVLDADSLGAMDLFYEQTGIAVGPSTGTNLAGSLELATKMRMEGRAGAIVSLICDRAERYFDTLASADWRRNNDIDTTPFRREAVSLLSHHESI